MNLTVMNLSRLRDLSSNLGWKNDDNTYVIGHDCLNALKSLEDELLNEDVLNRNVRLGLHICNTVKEDLIPILTNGKDAKVLSTATRVLVNLSLPVECLLPREDILTPRIRNVQKQLVLSSLAIKKSFLDAAATLSLVSMLRESMIKSEKHMIPLKDEDCNHLKNCLNLMRNLLHLSEDTTSYEKGLTQIHSEFLATQSKFIWNLFVQGVDGALLLMLNSKYRAYWTAPLAHIIALLYRGQSISKVHLALELVSSASESSGDEESDGSKNSSSSLSSEPSKSNGLSDSGCPSNSDVSVIFSDERKDCLEESKKCGSLDIHTELEKVQICDDDPKFNIQVKRINSSKNGECKMKVSSYRDNDSESSSSSESPHHKKIKGSNSSSDGMKLKESSEGPSKYDSALCESMDHSSPDITESKSSDDDLFEDKKSKNLKAVHKLRCLQIHSKILESDSSNEDVQDVKVKYRSHPPAGRRGKSPRRNNGCIPSVCMDSAFAVSCVRGRMRYPLWEKRNSFSALVDASCPTPTDDDIGNLLKEFTLSFMHSGFSKLVLEIKDLLLQGPSAVIDRSLFFWLLSYFLHLAASVNISLDHISAILSVEVISFLVYECVTACENMELHCNATEKICKYYSVQLDLLVNALKEILNTVDLYTRKPSSQKDKSHFTELCSKLAELQDLRLTPLLLFQSARNSSRRCMEDIVILNHQILTIVERGSENCMALKKMNIVTHLKQFSTRNVMNCYGNLLENFKTNSHFLNECVFTMMHHIAGDVHSSQLLIEPSVLKTFSSILKEDMELEQYQEDLIMYILNKFSMQVKRESLRVRKAEKVDESDSSDDSSSNSSVSSNCLLSEDDDDLFWWYLQFEQDKDPISRISEHISTSKRDILSKLQLKGIISPEKYQQLEAQMTGQEPCLELLPNDNLAHMTNFDDDITHLMRTIVQAGERQHLTWLQDVLLETCYVKLGLNTYLPEPVPLYSIRMMMSIPLVPYTEEQRLILRDEVFLQLLQKLGLHLGLGDSQMYPRVPLFWKADVLFAIAARLGPMRKDKLKFTYEELMLADPNHDPILRNTLCPPLPPLSSCCTLSSWLTAVQQSKEYYRTSNINKTAF
ncbi:protein timeless-like isoform X2 [Stegodyphus dumicola]|uniref:protein timeless-like isoform X2 n=1 Tax=Stegodyphus dumicola TaxID=202533 RepID=UPI0015AE21AB|nr:protein timeless-like isoform X2 [Stegodyphus dumicola]